MRHNPALFSRKPHPFTTCANFAARDEFQYVQNLHKLTEAAIAKAFAESEFEQYRVIQDRLYQSDFDKLIESTEISKDNKDNSN